MGFGFGQRYVVVNIPAAYAEAIENDKVVRRYRVIVGKTEKPSPTLTAEITNVNLNPTWTVPASITRNPRSPPICARIPPISPACTWNCWIRTMAYWILAPSTGPRATHPILLCGSNPEPGTRSARSASKMPNSLFGLHARHQPEESVQRRLPLRFARLRAGRQRPRSGGRRLLKELPKWNRQEIDQVIASAGREDIHLPQKIPVAWIYLTGWMTRDQTVQFRNGPHVGDAQLLEATAEEEAFFDQASAHPLAGHLANTVANGAPLQRSAIRARPDDRRVPHDRATPRAAASCEPRFFRCS